MKYILTGTLSGYEVEIPHTSCLYKKKGYYLATSSTKKRIVSIKDILNYLNPNYLTWPTYCYRSTPCKSYSERVCINTKCIKPIIDNSTNILFRPSTTGYSGFPREISGMIISRYMAPNGVTIRFFRMEI